MRIKAIVALLLSGTMLVGAPAGVALAHTFTDDTSITLNVSDRNIQRGDEVIFSGHLSSEHATCHSGRVVRLYRNGVRVATTTTNKSGYYRFKRTIYSTATWQVRFGGSVGGTHPHSHTCLRSGSRRITIHVQN
jgi:hypothetical protein